MNSKKLIFRTPGFRAPNNSALFQNTGHGAGIGQGHGWPPLGFGYGPGHGGGPLASGYGFGHGGGPLSFGYGTGHDSIPLRFAYGSGHGATPLRVGAENEKLITLGYLPELPDGRDKNSGHIKEDSYLKSALRGRHKKRNSLLTKFVEGETPKLPKKIDLRSDLSNNKNYFSPVEDQGSLGSCTANAVVGLVEFLLRAEGNKNVELSRLFLYKVTRNLMGVAGDYGAHIRSTIKALRLFGCTPQKHWPYIIETFDQEPDGFLYSLAGNFKALGYMRLDNPSESGEKVLKDVQACLADGYPIAFGFPVYSSIDQISKENQFLIPTPTKNDSQEGGHAVLAIGYDDDRQAILIRNSWGSDWGDNGHAWLPYEYVLSGLARDFWTVYNNDWVSLAEFA